MKRTREKEEIYGILKYRYHGDGDHFLEGHLNNMVAIPNKKGTKGKRIFQKANQGAVLNLILVDLNTQEVVGYFISNGEVTVEDIEVFTKDPITGEEAWENRVYGASFFDRKKAFPVSELKAAFNSIHINNGSVQLTCVEAFDWTKQKCVRKV